MTFDLIDEEPRSPQWVRCTCGHQWIGLYLPMLAREAAKVMGRLTCPMCAAGADKVFPINPPQEGDNKGENR